MSGIEKSEGVKIKSAKFRPKKLSGQPKLTVVDATSHNYSASPSSTDAKGTNLSLTAVLTLLFRVLKNYEFRRKSNLLPLRAWTYSNGQVFPGTIFRHRAHFSPSNFQYFHGFLSSKNKEKKFHKFSVLRFENQVKLILKMFTFVWHFTRCRGGTIVLIFDFWKQGPYLFVYNFSSASVAKKDFFRLSMNYQFSLFSVRCFRPFSVKTEL